MSDRLYTQIADDGGPLLKRVYKENIMDTNEITFKKWPNHFSGNRQENEATLFSCLCKLITSVPMSKSDRMW